MASLNLPSDLAAFLQEGKQFEYAARTCEAREVTLLPRDQLKVELFPMDCQSTAVAERDPHRGELGCYLVEAVNLIVACSGGYDPVGLLLWLPCDQRYGVWDSSHDVIMIFNPATTWADIVRAPAQHINAQWIGMFSDSVPASCLEPWHLHPYSAEQVHHPLPDLEEWYEAKWSCWGEKRDGVVVREPAEIHLRLERDGERCEIVGERCEIVGERREMDESKKWRTVTNTRHPLTSMEWEQAKERLDVAFWGDPEKPSSDGQTRTTWSFKGYRSGSYHTIYRSYDQRSCEHDPVHELGMLMRKMARL